MVPHFRVFGSSNVLYNLTLDEFINYKPPCKECLVQVMCLKSNDNISLPWIRTRLCGKLNEFVVMSDWAEIQLG